MKKLLTLFAALTILAACTQPLTPAQRAEQAARNLPLPTAAVPDCIASALGKQPNYSKLAGLGYKNYKPLVGSGVNFKSEDWNGFLGTGTTLQFNANEGCTASYGYETDNFEIIGNAWISALKNAGYTQSAGNQSTFDFVASGVPMKFRGTHRISNYSNVMEFSIQRSDR